MKPLFIWAGGKTKMMKHYEDLFPSTFEHKIESYSEPFFGGGAMLLNVVNRYPSLKKVYVNDINGGLTSIYRNIKNIELSKITKTYKLLLSFISHEESLLDN